MDPVLLFTYALENPYDSSSYYNYCYQLRRMRYGGLLLVKVHQHNRGVVHHASAVIHLHPPPLRLLRQRLPAAAATSARSAPPRMPCSGPKQAGRRCGTNRLPAPCRGWGRACVTGMRSRSAGRASYAWILHRRPAQQIAGPQPVGGACQAGGSSASGPYPPRLRLMHAPRAPGCALRRRGEPGHRGPSGHEAGAPGHGLLVGEHLPQAVGRQHDEPVLRREKHLLHRRRSCHPDYLGLPVANRPAAVGAPARMSAGRRRQPV